MGQRFSTITAEHKAFIEAQKIFFVGTATADSRVNISPKGMDSLRVLNENRVIWLNVTGSGNETAAHVQALARMTILFSAFEGKALILRLYGTARVIHPRDDEWAALSANFPPMPGARQIFDLNVTLVQSSCGTAVPFFDYVEDRDELKNWAVKKGEKGLTGYWKRKNQMSLDGKPTNILNDGE